MLRSQAEQDWTWPIASMRGRPARYRERYEAAAAEYEATGNPQSLDRVRWDMYWKLGFIMAFTARTRPDAGLQAEAFGLLESASMEYPEVPWRTNIAGSLRTWRATGRDGTRSRSARAIL